MSSAFVRRTPVRALDAGTRPGLAGQVLVSTGLAGLDRLLGGGLPLGCVLLLLEDPSCEQHLNLLRLFMAEGLACKHSIGWVSPQASLSAEQVAAFLPETAKPGSSAGGQQQPAPAPRHQPAQAAGAPDDGLRIAWQYRKYVQQPLQGAPAAAPAAASSSRSSSANASSTAAAAAKAVAAGIGREWCRQYDLTKPLSPGQLAGARLDTFCCGAQQQPQQPGCTAVQAAGVAAAAFARRFLPAGPVPVPSRDPAAVGRLVVQSLGGPAWWPSQQQQQQPSASSLDSWAELEAAVLRAVAELRLAVQDAACAAIVTCPAALFSEATQAHLAHLGDGVLALQSLADDSDIYRLVPEPASASALLHARRLPSLGLIRSRASEEALWLLRTKRRSISLAPLDLVPLEAAADPGAEPASGAGHQRPAAAAVCSAGGKPSVVDF